MFENCVFKVSVNTKKWAKKAGIRAVKTVAQTAVATIGTATALGQVDAKLVIDDSEEARDRLELNAQIYLKFMPNLEYINIGLIATPQGVSFDDI